MVTKNILIVTFVVATLMLSNDWLAVVKGGAPGRFYVGEPSLWLVSLFHSFPAGVLIYRIVYERNLQMTQNLIA